MKVQHLKLRASLMNFMTSSLKFSIPILFQMHHLFFLINALLGCDFLDSKTLHNKNKSFNRYMIKDDKDIHEVFLQVESKNQKENSFIVKDGEIRIKSECENLAQFLNKHLFELNDLKNKSSAITWNHLAEFLSSHFKFSISPDQVRLKSQKYKSEFEANRKSSKTKQQSDFLEAPLFFEEKQNLSVPEISIEDEPSRSERNHVGYSLDNSNVTQEQDFMNDSNKNDFLNSTKLSMSNLDHEMKLLNVGTTLDDPLRFSDTLRSKYRKSPIERLRTENAALKAKIVFLKNRISRLTSDRAFLKSKFCTRNVTKRFNSREGKIAHLEEDRSELKRKLEKKDNDLQNFAKLIQVIDKKPGTRKRKMYNPLLMILN